MVHIFEMVYLHHLSVMHKFEMFYLHLLSEMHEFDLVLCLILRKGSNGCYVWFHGLEGRVYMMIFAVSRAVFI